jgi:hypothetical protein
LWSKHELKTGSRNVGWIKKNDLKQIFIVIIILFLWFHVKDGRNNSRKSSQTCSKKKWIWFCLFWF